MADQSEPRELIRISDPSYDGELTLAALGPSCEIVVASGGDDCGMLLTPEMARGLRDALTAWLANNQPDARR